MFKNHKNHYAWQNPVLLINSLFPYSLKAHTMMQTTFYSKEKQKSFFFSPLLQLLLVYIQQEFQFFCFVSCSYSNKADFLFLFCDFNVRQ